MNDENKKEELQVILSKKSDSYLTVPLAGYGVFGYIRTEDHRLLRSPQTAAAVRLHRDP